jgi:thiamine biosynthesis lipoprotein
MTVTKSNHDARLLIPKGMKPADVRASRIDAPVRRLSGATMGTGWSLSFAAAESVANADVMAALEETFALVIRQMSGWEPQSDLCRFNGAGEGWHELQPEFFAVLSRALEIAELTDGAYDPALARRMDMLGFGPALGPLGDGEKRASWRDVRLDAEARRAFQPGGVGLDLSSIAKGYAVDLCAARLREMGVPSFLMEIGGEFVGQGVKPDVQPWWVALELSDMPPAPGETPAMDVALVNLAVATSGDFVRRRDGVSHLLDGRTGKAPAGEVCGVAVIHDSCMDADGWATALFSLGLGDGLAMAERQGLAAVFAVRTAEGSRTHLSSAASAMAE